MKRMSRVCCTLALLLLSLGAVTSADAAGLAAFSPNPFRLNGVIAGGMPAWFQDQNGIAVMPCLDVARCGLVSGPGFNAGLPLAYPGNFPDEFFYFAADADVALGTSSALVIMALEVVFVDANGNPALQTAPGALTAPFQRLRVIHTSPGGGGATPAGNFTITHPWGVTTYAADDPLNRCVNQGGDTKCTFTRDIFSAPPNFVAALGATIPAPDSGISTFLSDPTAPQGFLGIGAGAASFTGGALRNSVTVTDPFGNTGTTTALSLLMGQKIGMDVNPSPTVPIKGVVAAAVPAATAVTVTNLSGALLDFSAATAINIDPASPNAADFTIANPPAGTPTCLGASIPALAPNNICSFNVVFNPAPSAIAARAATVKITPAAANTNAPPTTLTLAGTAQFPVTVTVGTNGALQKVLAGGNVAAVTEPADAGSTVSFLALPNTVVPNVSNFFPVVNVNGLAVRAANDGTFGVPVGGTPQTVDVTFVRPGDVFADQAGASDGQVTISDAVETLKIVTGLNATPAAAQRVAADVGPLSAGKPTPDGLVDISDVLAVLWRVVSPTNPNW